MRLRLIRNATMLWDYAGQRILTDPLFADRFALPSYSGRSRNPVADLPLPIDDILAGVELVLLSHRHGDHLDAVARERLPKTLPLYCQPTDAAALQSNGFEHVTPVESGLAWPAGTLTRIQGHHGVGPVEAEMGVSSGYVLQAPGEPTVYWVGDSVLCDETRAAIERYHPDVIVTHSGGALWPVGPDGSGGRALIIMDAAQTIATSRLAPWAQVVAIHLDSVDHATISRADLRQAVGAEGLEGRILIPEDGEELTFASQS
jgi:L-ascorbate metabolism protein UlaG (beta-lactamase superfamily)